MAGRELSLDRIDAAVVDLDGVVTDTAAMHAAAWTELFNGFLATTADSAPFDPDADYLRFVDGKPRADGVVSFLASRGIALPTGTPDDPPTAISVCGLSKRKNELFRARLARDGVPVFASTVAFLQRLRAAGKSIAVVSSSRNCRDVLDAAGIAWLFDVIVDGVTAAEEVLAGKPDPATFLYAVTELRVAAPRTLVVEDAVAGIEAARRGGFWPVLAVDRHQHADALRRAGADMVIDDLADVTMSTTDPELPAAWSIGRDESAPTVGMRTHDALFALSDGIVGVRGDLESGAPGRGWLTLVAGAFGAAGDGSDMVRLLPGPSLATLASTDPATAATLMQRTLDLRSGVLECRPAGNGRGLATTRYVSLSRPGLVVVRAEGEPGARWSDRALEPPRLGSAQALAAAFTYHDGALGEGTWWAETRSDRARVVGVARQRSGASPTGPWFEQLSVFRADGGDVRDDAERVLSDAAQQGFEVLLAEQRRDWARRWDDADIEIDGDDRSQEAIRFALFHLLSCAPTSGEAGVGARGLTGLAYAGHVFWDADVFVLPALSAILPAAAATMLQYRVQRLPAARRAAAARGGAGARFPWESADTGEDVTPRSVRDHEGKIVEILTGPHEEHITADVAWATQHYVDWTGDSSRFAGVTGRLIVETGRYWASRVRVGDDGRAHLDRVMGPDEYHEVVDDNAFTNIMVRWHLRCAATIVESADPDEASRWRRLADALTDGLDASTHRHEQFVGFWQLEPLRIADITDVPVAADVLLGAQRVALSQVIKQPDVLMAHHLVPDDVTPASLVADLDFYLPRTAHGSSLSPAICASLLARAGRPDEALALFDLAARLDLDDLTGMTGGGLHLATLGGLWQAVVFGFAGVRPNAGVLRVEPALPTRWSRLQVRLRFHEIPIHLDLGHDRVVIQADGPASLSVYGIAVRGSAEFIRQHDEWRQR